MTNQTSENNKRIAKNTLLLYVRMIFIMLINLYTSRVILQALGVKDYGIYNVVGGFVAMFGLISNSLSAAITRFITFELGTGNKDKLNKIFSSSVTIQLAISLIIVIAVEIVGIWFVNNKMVVEPERLVAANWCLQLSMITFCFNIIAVPYNALIIAHEKMTAFAYISVFEAVLKLGVCFLVMLSSSDKLVCYAVLLSVVALLIRTIYGIYCRRNFEESKYHFYFDKSLLLKMFAFSGWNFIGAGAGVLREQGVNLLINIFWGTTLNASRGIAQQVSAAVTSFSSSFISAVNPQITKSYAADDREHSFLLVIHGARLSYYLLLLISLPVFLETPILLRAWLTVVPDYSVSFVRLTLLYVMMESLSYTMMTLMLASGRIKNYQLIVGSLQLLNFPISYLLLWLGCTPDYTYVAAIIIAIICLFVRLILLNQMTGLSILEYLKKVILNVILVSIVGALLPIVIIYYMNESFTRLFITVGFSTISLFLTYVFVGCNRQERKYIITKIKDRIQ